MATQSVPVDFTDLNMTSEPGERIDSGLPSPLTSFLGRDEVISRVVRLLDDPSVRLLTLTGPGGVGKTRLAIEVAHRIRADFADGACFVPLAPVGDPTLVLPAIAHVLGIPTHPTQPLWDTLVDTLRDGHLLLLLDNFEHLLFEPPAWLAELIATCPRLTVLVTSQVALHVGGEQRFEVPPLRLSSRSGERAGFSEAVALFEQRAQAVRPDFAVNSKNQAAVERICRAVDGLPLAIELAASRILFLHPAEIAAHLSHRLRLLTGGQRDMPPRLQSMHNAMTWSHDLLDSNERRLFRRLAVFVDGFTLDAAEEVCAGGEGTAFDVLGGLASLLDHSLIRRDDESDHARFMMLEVIREFGVEQLEASGEIDVIRDRHADQCLAIASRVAPGPQHRSQPELSEIARFEADYGNVRAALAWLDESGRHGDLAQLAMYLRSFWYLTDRYEEALRWLERLLQLNPEPSIDVLCTAGQMAQLLGTPDAAHYLERALARAEPSGDAYQEAEARFHLAIHLEDSGAYAQAERLFVEAQERYERAGNALGMRQSDYHLGVVAFGLGRLPQAKRRLEEVIVAAQAAGDPLLPVWSYNYLVLIACEERNAPRAVELLRRQAQVLAAPALRHHVPDFLAAAGVVAVARCQFDRAGRLLGASGRSPRALMLPERAAFERAFDTAREHLGEAELEREFAIGRHLTEAEIGGELTDLLDGDDTPGSQANRTSAPRDVALDLSSRQLDVLRLVADGLTNQEIADALFISPRTVATHVDHILAKLDVRSRTAAVACAIRNGLA
ncbi:MAG TPA: LuxR C-terminal-related transcriptional regulator [Thermomicrobiales bacterium]|nr:LuxR C-terminal-related transcriptional regulator [Thermomicrobiales bacterium]